MNKKSIILLAAVALLFFLHIASALYQGSILPNCTRSYSEGMDAQYLTLDQPFSPVRAYSPLYETGSYFAAELAGRSWTAIYLINNTPFFVLLLVFLYLLGKELKDRETGLCAALIVMLYPVFSSAYNQFSMEFPLLALVAMFLYFLHRSDYLRDTAYSAAAGVTVLFGLGVKEPFAAFVAGPLALVLVLGARDAARKSFSRLLFLSAITASAAALGIAYFGTGQFFFNFWGRMLYEPAGPAWYSFDNVRLFWIGLWESQLTIPFFLLLLWGVYYFVKERDARAKISLLLVVLVSDAFVLFMPHVKTERYLLPQLPVFAIVSAYGLRRMLDIAPGKIFAVLLAAFGVFQLYDLTYDKAGLERLRYGGLYYWNPAEMLTSVPAKLRSTELLERAGRAVLNDIAEREKTGEKKKIYAFTFVPRDSALEAYTIQSYILLNSDKRMKNMPRARIARRIAYGTDYRIDYIVQKCPKGETRQDIASPAFLKRAFERYVKMYSNAGMPMDWERINRTWLRYAKTFEDLGPVCGDDSSDIFLYRSGGERKSGKPGNGGAV